MNKILELGEFQRLFQPSYYNSKLCLFIYLFISSNREFRGTVWHEFLVLSQSEFPSRIPFCQTDLNKRLQWTCTDLNMNPISRRCGPCISIKGMHQWNCPLLTHVGVTMKLVVVGFANGLEYAKGVLSKKKEDALEAKKGVECL